MKFATKYENVQMYEYSLVTTTIASFFVYSYTLRIS